MIMNPSISILLSQAYAALETMQTKITESLRNYSAATMTKLMEFSYFINAASEKSI